MHGYNHHHHLMVIVTDTITGQILLYIIYLTVCVYKQKLWTIHVKCVHAKECPIIEVVHYRECLLKEVSLPSQLSKVHTHTKYNEAA